MQRQTSSSRLNPSYMVRGVNISTKLSSSFDLARRQNTPSQTVTSMISSQKHTARSSQASLPRCVSVKKYTDGSPEVTLKSSVSVSLAFKQNAIKVKEVGGNLEEMHDSRHQLVCCTCMMYKPSILVGECGCLSCMDCLELIKHGYCNNCQVSARYISLEKLIIVNNDGNPGKIFMDTNDRGKDDMKELLEKVVKGERDFKTMSKILDKQKAAFEKKYYYEKKEMQEILDEANFLEQKILAKYEAISELEEALRPKQDLSYPVQQDQQLQTEMPRDLHPSAFQVEEYNKVGQERLEINGDSTNFFSGEPSVNVVRKAFEDDKDQDYRINRGIEQHSKTIGHKLVAYSENHRVGGAVVNNQINFTPCKDDEAKPAPVVLKSILKKKKSLSNQSSMTNEGIDEVGGSASKMVGREMLKVSKCVKPLKVVGFATVDQRKLATQSVSVVKEMKDKDMRNKMMISQIRQDDAVIENSKLNVEIDKAAHRRKSINIGSESSKNEDIKRMKLAASNGGHNRRTSMKNGVMSEIQRMDRAVKNRADVSKGVFRSNYGERRNDESEEVAHCKEWTYSHRGGWRGHNGEGRSADHVKNIAYLTPGSVKAEKKDKFTPLPSVYYPRSKFEQANGTRKRINEKKEHNMTYDYLDAIGGSSNASSETYEGPSFNSNKKVRVKDTSHQSDLAEEIAKSGGVGVVGKNSEVFWEEYFL